MTTLPRVVLLYESQSQAGAFWERADAADHQRVDQQHVRIDQTPQDERIQANRTEPNTPRFDQPVTPAVTVP